MVFVVPTYDIVYAAVPKAACTSLKRAMYRLEHGTAFTGEVRNGRRLGLQQAFPTTRFDRGDFAQLSDPWLFAVIRDPAERVLSTWSERVMGAGRLQVANDRRMGKGLTRIMRRVTGGMGAQPMLDPRPSLDAFVLNLDHYASAYPAVAHHVQSASWFLGPDLGAYNRIYTMAELDRLEADIRARTGVADFAIPHRNASPKAYRATIDDLSDAAHDSLMTWLAPEYEFLGQWFDMPRRDQRNTQQTGTI
jgi:hypothetical protein